jgi:P27 family predicted phage terminase small subunit
MRGQRKPTALKLLEGEPNKKRIRKKEATPKKAYRDPPKELPALARQKWKELAPKLYNLGLLTEIDYDAFSALCILYSKYAEAEKVATLGIVRTNSGYVTQNPMINVSLKYFEKYHRLLSDFGMTPASRSKIDAITDQAPKPIENFLNVPRIVKS